MAPCMAIDIGGTTTLILPTITGLYKIPLLQWTLLSGTYDGSNCRWYINGNLANTTAASGTLVVGTGPYCIGGVPAAGQFHQGLVDDCRVDSGVVRSQSYYQSMYNLGVGHY